MQNKEIFSSGEFWKWQTPDMPNEDEKRVAEFFCHAINEGEFHNFKFSFDTLEGVPRVILRGETSEVLELVERYYHQ